MEAWSVSAEEVEVAAYVASAQRVDMAALVASAERVDVAALILPSLAVALAAGVCLPCSQSGVQFLVGWGPLLAVGEVYRLAVDGVDPNWDVAPPLV